MGRVDVVGTRLFVVIMGAVLREMRSRGAEGRHRRAQKMEEEKQSVIVMRVAAHRSRRLVVLMGVVENEGWLNEGSLFRCR